MSTWWVIKAGEVSLHKVAAIAIVISALNPGVNFFFLLGEGMYQLYGFIIILTFNEVKFLFNVNNQLVTITSESIIKILYLQLAILGL